MTAPAAPDYSLADLAGLIDHAVLSPVAGPAELEAGCALAAAYGVASVCACPHLVADAARLLRGTGVRVGTVIAFPHGTSAPAAKAAEAEVALADGAVELDMVANAGRALAGDWDFVERDIAAVAAKARAAGAKTKVIFETGRYDDLPDGGAEIVRRLCEVCGVAGADWVKTSTGFGPRGAGDDDLRRMTAAAPPGVQVKASGGIRTLDRLLEVRALGVTRAGLSGTAAVLGEACDRLGIARRAPAGDSGGGAY